MSDEEITKLYQELEEHYGDKLVNFEHHPRQFLWQLTTYRYYKERRNERSDQRESTE